jgi:hypothetical protein|tara:strand:- start:409 stop:726 length:318 start_codon:yes stop_codon:yes gene_type:complete
MTYKAQILAALSEFEVTPDSIAEQLAQVIKGETVTERYNGKGELTSKIVKRDPTDAMRGAMIYDAMHGGELGIAPKTLDFKKPTEIAHKRMLVDSRIIVTPDEPE